MATPIATRTTMDAESARTLYAAEKAKRTLAQRAKAAVGIVGKELSENEAARRQRCKASRSIVRKYMRALDAATNDALESDVRAYWNDVVNRMEQKYNEAQEQLALERKR